MKIQQEIINAIRESKPQAFNIEGFPLRLELDDTHLWLYSSPSFFDSHYHFGAVYKPSGFIEFDIVSGAPGLSFQYPGLYAKDLMKLAIEHFKKRGKTIKGIKAEW